MRTEQGGNSRWRERGETRGGEGERGGLKKNEWTRKGRKRGREKNVGKNVNKAQGVNGCT